MFLNWTLHVVKVSYIVHQPKEHICTHFCTIGGVKMSIITGVWSEFSSRATSTWSLMRQKCLKVKHLLPYLLRWFFTVRPLSSKSITYQGVIYKTLVSTPWCWFFKVCCAVCTDMESFLAVFGKHYRRSFGQFLAWSTWTISSCRASKNSPVFSGS